MRSQVKPMRSSAPGAKFSTMTSQIFTRASSTSLPLGLRASMVMDRLLWFSMVKYRLSTLGTSCSWPRVMSPVPGRSTLITSAPNHASSCVQVGPDCTWVKSRILTPSSAFILRSSLLRQGAFRVEIADVATLAARRRIDRRVDQRGLAGVHGRVDGALQLVRRGRIDANPAEPLDHPVVAGTLDERGGGGVGAAARIDTIAAIDAVVVEHHDADRQVVAADRLHLHAGEAKRAVALDGEDRLAGLDRSGDGEPHADAHHAPGADIQALARLIHVDHAAGLVERVRPLVHQDRVRPLLDHVA